MTSSSIYQITKWLGINENPDSDTELKAGEAAEMRNFRITTDFSLQLRPGSFEICPADWGGPLRGVWTGYVGDRERVVFAAGGSLYEFDFETRRASSISHTSISDGRTEFFGFSGKLYIQTGHEYLEWDGENPPCPVEGYRPLVVISALPSGGGTTLEAVNKLTCARRVRFSPDGTATHFKLPEGDLQSVDYVKYLGGGTITDYTVNLEEGVITFSNPPASGTNSLEIGYSHTVNSRQDIEKMRFSEIYNGATDNRVFLYGDGTNRAFYSGLDYDGRERADYFPDLNVLHIGTANTPVTAMVRHYARLAVFKTDSAYSVTYGTITTAEGKATAAFYITPSNRSVGNEVAGAALVVQNSPRTLADQSVIEWRNHSGYASNLTSDERQARIISQRVKSTLSAMDFGKITTFYDRSAQEYYVMEGGCVLVHSIQTDTWFVYENFYYSHLFSQENQLYGATLSGDIVHISRQYQNDRGENIKAYWRSGSLSFGKSWRQKYSPGVFLTLKPEPRSLIGVSAVTNKAIPTPVRLAASGLADFTDLSFAHWSFGTNRRPQTIKLKLRTKKFSYYQLHLESDTGWSTATVVAADIQLRFGGKAR